MRHGRGFTIIELMLAIVVLGFLAALAVPSFNTMIVRNIVAAASNDLVVALLTARSEAVKRECLVSVSNVVPSPAISNGNDDDDWKLGWSVNVVDTTSSPSTSALSDCTVQEIVRHEVSINLDKEEDKMRLKIDVAGNIGTAVTYDPEGRARGLLGPVTGINRDFFTLTLETRREDDNDVTKVVCLTLFGRPYVPDTPPYPYVQSGADCS